MKNKLNKEYRGDSSFLVIRAVNRINKHFTARTSKVINLDKVLTMNRYIRP
tara:strand:+ start:632 stop:784 length:153 start_codon:yes stop_codon:yes gene_type:complete